MTATDHAYNARAAMEVCWEIDSRNQSIYRAIMAELTSIADRWEDEYYCSM